METTKVEVSMGPDRKAQKPKLIVKIVKADTFEQKMKEWDELVEFNKAQAEKFKPSPK